MESKQYVDITEELFGSLKSITNNKVIQSEYFDLLEGARAVEVTNHKLDTGMILSNLTESELNFDCYKPINGKELIAIANKLFKLFMSWLNNSSLPLTVLSCRYIQELISYYSSQVDKSGLKLSLGEDIFNQILTGIILGISKIVGVLITVGNTVLYEEEDLTTRSMDLNFLNEILIDEILDHLENCIYLVKTISDPSLISVEDKQILCHQLQLLINLNKLPILFNLSIELFNNNMANLNQIGFFNDILSNGQINVDFLIKHESQIESYQVPNGSFSKYIQGKLNNRTIPGEIFEINFNDSFNQMNQMFQDIQDVFNKLTKLMNLIDFERYLKYDITIRIDRFNAVTRGLFQLYLIRDDQSIMGSSTNLSLLTKEMMNQYNLFNCNIMNKLTWNISTSDTQLVESQLDQLFKDLEVAMYQNLIIAGNNKCRQRQLLNKNLMIWENLGNASENLELLLYQRFKIFDREENLYLPITSFIKCTKIKLLIEYLLLGIELDLYKPFEIYSIYWAVNYLIDKLIERFQQDFEFNKFKLGKIKAIIKKKKFKTNQQKIDLTNKRDKLNQIVNQQNQTFRYIQTLRMLIDTTRKMLLYYHQQPWSDVDFTKVPNKFIVDMEKLFKLRFKAFDPIGEFSIRFDHYLKSITQSATIQCNELEQDFNQVRTDLGQYNQMISHEQQKGWNNNLIKCCVMYVLQLKKQGKFVLEPGYHEYFPKFIES